ncbi:MAG TPA: helix-turn-helix domain-containing protein [Mycobacteriales bacterium]|nr:helix-turn-helix domain-containing protein [Mycobacteriales bacterium]
MAELKKGNRITGAERDKLSAGLRKRYDAGESIRDLASSTGRSYGFVHRVLVESGAKLRGRGGPTRRKQS